MGSRQRAYKQKIRSTQTLAKVFRAMEMIAASRVGEARRRATQVGPYEKALTQAVAAVAVHTDLDHPLTSERTDTDRVAVVAVASDRGMAGAYSATILRSTTKLLDDLREEGREAILFTVGRRASAFFRFRKVPIAGSWEGKSDSPDHDMIDEISDELLDRFLSEDPERAVSKVFLVFTRFRTLMVQVPEVRQMLPLTIVDAPQSDAERERELGFEDRPERAYPEYEFEPSARAVLDSLLPLYVNSRIGNALLQAAASELAARQSAMHSASDNADEIISTYERLANSARQAEITQEVTEITSSADALTVT